MALLAQVTRRSPGKLLALGGALLVLAMSGGGTGCLAQTREYEVKAAFLFNFAQFCEWPEEAFDSTNSPLVIGVLGEDPFGRSLDEIVRGEFVQRRRIEVRRYRSVNEIRECHILFISRSEQPHIERILSRLDTRPILTVSDMENFAARGGMIRFFTEQKRVRLRINISEVRRGRLNISSKVLNLAEVVQNSPRGE